MFFCRKKNHLFPENVSIKCENRKHLVPGPWCQSRGLFSDKVSGLKKSKCYIWLELNFLLFSLDNNTLFSSILCTKFQYFTPIFDIKWGILKFMMKSILCKVSDVKKFKVLVQHKPGFVLFNPHNYTIFNFDLLEKLSLPNLYKKLP